MLPITFRDFLPRAFAENEPLPSAHLLCIFNYAGSLSMNGAIPIGIAYAWPPTPDDGPDPPVSPPARCPYSSLAPPIVLSPPPLQKYKVTGFTVALEV